MTPFRGSDERLDREIETLEAIARVRVRRVAQELREIDKELADLRGERARRRVVSVVPVTETSRAVVES